MMRDKKKKKGGVLKINLTKKKDNLSSKKSQQSNSELNSNHQKDISINTAIYKEFGVVTMSEAPQERQDYE